MYMKLQALMAQCILMCSNVCSTCRYETSTFMAQCALLCSHVCKQFTLHVNNNKPHSTYKGEILLRNNRADMTIQFGLHFHFQ